MFHGQGSWRGLIPVQGWQCQSGLALLLSVTCLKIPLNFSEGILKGKPAKGFNAVVIQPVSCLVFRNYCHKEGGD